MRSGAGDWGATKAGVLLEQHEILLSELALSNPLEMPAVVEANAERLDESFYNCDPPTPPLSPRHAQPLSHSCRGPLTLAATIASSSLPPPPHNTTVLEMRILQAQDAGERDALCLLRDCITDLMQQMIAAAIKVTHEKKSPLEQTHERLRIRCLHLARTRDQEHTCRCDWPNAREAVSRGLHLAGG